MGNDYAIYYNEYNGYQTMASLITLNVEKEVFLINIVDEKNEARFIRNKMIMIGRHIITSRYADTAHFMQEMRLFERGNDQNKYLSIRDYKGTRNLKLKCDGIETKFFSKSEANTIREIYDQSFSSSKLSFLLENEFIFSREMLKDILDALSK